ncbi:MAG: Dam family site-specific DNA-(adenine-N6)-methyltransferase [Bacteroidaceae bacterium]|nr:Dam family site-specific DNA-(adenine-N6)-methyltransferase [Bacteroidaceae bacterium]MEA5018003.1 Dam family site-specific DNA-(adenine-N6)-methyltransferase [Erysipelotrichaceae bacterium]
MQPFVKWAGGKRQLLTEILKRLPHNFDTYYEPFIGGGALLFDLAPSKAVVGDINKVLVDTYQAIKNNSALLMRLLEEYEKRHNSAIDKKYFYYSMRDCYNNKITNDEYNVETAALFMYLNKTCFNGLYRVNSKGLFNVPFNNCRNLVIYNKENIEEISIYMKQVDIEVRDFEETCKNAKEGDFVFFDSPYAPLKDDSFESYTKDGFALEEHVRLAKLYKRLSNRGIKCILTNHNTKLINDLYKDFKIEVIQVKRMINRDTNNRTGEEVIITNY